MSNIAFIPARKGSKSVINKNIKLLSGYPLIYWTAKAASDAQCINQVVIATDSDEIWQALQPYSQKLPKIARYARDPRNAQDVSSTESVLIEYLQMHSETCQMKTQTSLSSQLLPCRPDDKIFLIQATSPMLTSEHIDGMHKKMQDTSADSALTCVKTKRFFWTKTGRKNDNEINKKEDAETQIDNSLYRYGQPLNYDYTKRLRRQEFEGIWMENGACYINSVRNILHFRNRLSGNILIYEMPEYTGIEIDTPDDFLLTAALMDKYVHK